MSDARSRVHNQFNQVTDDLKSAHSDFENHIQQCDPCFRRGPEGSGCCPTGTRLLKRINQLTEQMLDLGRLLDR